MNLQKCLPVLLFIASMTLTSCVGGVETQQPVMEEEPAANETMPVMPIEATMMDKPTEAAMMEESTEDTGTEFPAWFAIPLVDVRSGESFTLADFKGKVILVENMAIWCTTCLRQQKEVLALHEQMMERDDWLSLGLGIDPYEDAQMLKSYVEKNGFEWKYAIAPVEVSRLIGQLYGAQLLNPPSAPMLIVDRKGEVHVLPFGVKSAADLQKALEPFLDESM